jgi:hypothetical protein
MSFLILYNFYKYSNLELVQYSNALPLSHLKSNSNDDAELHQFTPIPNLGQYHRRASGSGKHARQHSVMQCSGQVKNWCGLRIFNPLAIDIEYSGVIFVLYHCYYGLRRMMRY